jgi:hypothetical protein
MKKEKRVTRKVVISIVIVLTTVLFAAAQVNSGEGDAWVTSAYLVERYSWRAGPEVGLAFGLTGVAHAAMWSFALGGALGLGVGVAVGV